MRDAEDLGLGQVDRPDARLVVGVLGALVGDEGRHRDEPVGPGPVTGGDLERGRVHRRGGGVGGVPGRRR